VSDTNKNLVRRYREIHDKNQMDKLGDVLAADYIPHSLLPGLPTALETYKQVHQMALASFPDYKVTTEDLFAEGDKVVERWNSVQTHSGAPFQGLPPSGKTAQAAGINIYRIANGKIAEMWAVMDTFGLMIQLGAIPVPGM